MAKDCLLYSIKAPDMEKPHKKCQSCGMPLSKDQQQNGTEADGSKSLLYCFHCYQDGRFTAPDMTLAEMKELVKEKLKGMGMPGFMSGFFTRNLQNLDRWKQ